MVWLAASPPDPMPKVREDLYRTCETVFKMTAGAFLGLMAGRAAAPDRVEVEPGESP